MWTRFVDFNFEVAKNRPMDISALKNIKMLVLDVDGILTDGTLWLDSNEEWKRAYSVYDGVGIKLVIEAGYQVGVITGGGSKDVEKRSRFLGIQHIYQGQTDKRPAFDDLLTKTGLKASEVLYMGDEIFDVPLLERAGFGATVPHAVDSAKAVAQSVTTRLGGHGAVREVCDLLIRYGHFA